MHQGCTCFHHKFVRFLSGVGMLAALLFFIAGFKSEMVWGYDAMFYFEAVVVLALAAMGSNMLCRCCIGHGMGYKCEDCKVGGGMNRTGGMEGMK